MTPIGFPGPLLSSGLVYPPPTFYANLFQWLTPGSIATTGGTVTEIFDLSGNSRHATNIVNISTGSTFPNGAAGLTVANTGSPGASTTSSYAPNLFANCSIFVVIKPTGTLNDFYGIYDHDYQTSFCLLLNSTANKWKLVMDTPGSPYGTCEGGTPTVNTTVLLSAIFTSSGGTGTGIIRVNGTQVASATMNTPSSSTASFKINFAGRNDTGAATGMGGLYGDGAIYTSAKSGTTLVNIEKYFGKKYGIF